MSNPPYFLLYVAISMLVILAPWFALCLASIALNTTKDRNEHSQSRR